MLEMPPEGTWTEGGGIEIPCIMLLVLSITNLKLEIY